MYLCPSEVVTSQTFSANKSRICSMGSKSRTSGGKNGVLENCMYQSVSCSISSSVSGAECYEFHTSDRFMSGWVVCFQINNLKGNSL